MYLAEASEKEVHTMINISAVVAEAEAMFDACNDRFYDGELDRPAITITPDAVTPGKGQNCYGWCSIKEIWNAENERFREINICADYLDRPIKEVAATMLHEMAHLYDLEHEIKDTSNGTYYHNQKFKKTAEEHGLVIAKHPRYGWTITTLNSDATAWVESEYGDRRFSASRTAFGTSASTSDDGSDGADGEEKPKKKNNSIKYTCPVCDSKVRATKQVNVICGDCMVPMETEAAGD
jgi:hypothetical protein